MPEIAEFAYPIFHINVVIFLNTVLLSCKLMENSINELTLTDGAVIFKT